MEIEFPLEFIVHGTPVSVQTKRAASKTQWRERVRQASRAAIPTPHFASEDRISVTIYYFPSQSKQGDIDNIVKPILDALSRHIYVDDNQVDRIVVQKFESDAIFNFRQPTPTLQVALKGLGSRLYIRLSNDPLEDRYENVF